jgi:hypothetical protein
MSFRASRLRVQIPCGGSGSILDEPDGGAKTPFCPDPKPPPPPPKPPPCGVPSELIDIGEALRRLGDPPEERFVLDAADLPLLRQHLELRLKMLERTAEAARQRVDAQLDDIRKTEEALRERGLQGEASE